MIISASRRTDIPAFYVDWFMNRLRDGYVYIRNPFNFNYISKVPLSPDLIECIVFWTKNPEKIIKKLPEIDSLGYKYYFQFTLTSYNNNIEINVPEKNKLLKIFKLLSKAIGKSKVIWRYDPILLTNIIDEDYHIKWFKYIANELKGYTNKCIISFLDMYKKCERNMKSLTLVPFTKKQQIELSSKLFEIALENGFKLETCAEGIELTQIGIRHGKCIDDVLISKIIGEEIKIEKDPSQRNECGCAMSIDVGAYNTCKHNCIYCYANYSYNAVKKNINLHDINSPLIISNIKGTEKIIERKMATYVKKQRSIY